MKKNAFLLFAFTTVLSVSFGQSNPTMRYEDKIRIREAIHISNQVGDQIWKGINEVPFAVLLIADSVEFLINHPNPSSDFTLLAYDSLLATNLYYRKKKFADGLLATFPAVNGINCIVVGTPEKTNKNSTDWVITLLHEHFHQYEFTSTDYYKSVDNLNLSGGDQTGMWQLNYAFPYDSAVVVSQYNIYLAALSRALANTNKKSFQEDFSKYAIERANFKKRLTPTDYRYFSFQIWQEGIAKYTEYKFLQSLVNYQPSSEMKQLADYVPLFKHKEAFYADQVKSLSDSKLEINKRECFYAIGFAEGLLLDKVNPNWHDLFLTDKFYVENYGELLAR